MLKKIKVCTLCFRHNAITQCSVNTTFICTGKLKNLYNCLCFSSGRQCLQGMPLLGFPGGSVVKNLPAVQEMQVQSLCQEDPLEKEMATHSSLLVKNESDTTQQLNNNACIILESKQECT